MDIPFLRGYKTIVLNALAILGGLVTQLTDYFQTIPDETGLAMLVMGVANVILRVITTTPVFQTKPQG